MKLSDVRDLISNFPIQQFQDLEVNKITRSSSDFSKGDVFVAINGTTWDGHDFIPQAIQQQASLIVCEENREDLQQSSIPYIVCNEPRMLLALLAKHYYFNPSEKLFCVGVTGTNGKTTSSVLMEHILNSNHLKCAYLGTVGHRFLQNKFETKLTSPDALALYKRLANFLDLGAEAAVMEISSHALDQKRAYGLELNSALFTNLTQDHLDYHKNIGNYFNAKLKLFSDVLELSSKKDRIAIFNCNDKYGERAFRNVELNCRKISFGREKGFDANFRIQKMSFAGSEFSLEFSGKKYESFIPMPGIFNVENAVGCALALVNKVPLENSLNAMNEFSGVSGRLERIKDPNDRYIFVDFAHTPEALRSVLRFLSNIREQTKLNSKIICVYGAGGDRDKKKRSLMANAVESFVDISFVTSDNPRTEKPEDIIEDIIKGYSSLNSVYKEVDRKEAIAKALEVSGKGDVVLIAGKGHEEYQEINGVKNFFSDQETILDLLKGNSCLGNVN